MARYNMPDSHDLLRTIAAMDRRLKNLESGNRIGFTSVDAGALVDNTSGNSTLIAGSGSTSSTATRSTATTTGETCNSAAYVDLTTIGPTFDVVIGQARRALVFIGVNVHMTINGGDTNAAYMSFQMVNGGVTIGPSDDYAAGVKIVNNNASAITVDYAISKVVPLLSMPVGTYTITGKYSGGTGTGGAASFNARTLTVFPY